MQGDRCVASLGIHVGNVIVCNWGMDFYFPEVEPDALRLVCDRPALAELKIAYPKGGRLCNIQDVVLSRIETLYLTSMPSESASADV
jgi:hypothetical protein